MAASADLRRSLPFGPLLWLTALALALTAFALLTGGCASDGSPGAAASSDRAPSTYRVEIEPIVVAESSASPDTAQLQILPAGGLAWTVEVDAEHSLARLRATVPGIVACPPGPGEGGMVELEVIQTRTEIYSRSEGCGTAADRWEVGPGRLSAYLLVPGQIDLDDPSGWLQKVFDRVFDGELRASFSLECAGIGAPLCEDLRATGADPAILVEAGVEEMVFDVDLDADGRIGEMRIELTSDPEVAGRLAGIGGARYRVLDYGVPVVIEAPVLDA